jgi:hypothetical protein
VDASGPHGTRARHPGVADEERERFGGSFGSLPHCRRRGALLRACYWFDACGKYPSRAWTLAPFGRTVTSIERQLLFSADGGGNVSR